MHLASHSYLLITVGMLMINAYPYSRLGQFEHIKISGYTTELVRAVVLASIELGVKKVALIEMGNEAQAVGDCAWASMKSKARGICRIKVSNPVRIARSHVGADNLPQPTMVAMTGLSRAIGLVTANYRLGASRRTDEWRNYGQHELELLLPHQSVTAMAKHASWKSILSLTSDFEGLLIQIITSKMNKGRNSGWQKCDEETENYVMVIMKTIVEMATGIEVKVRSSLIECENIRSQWQRADGGTADMDTCIEVMRASAEACATSASFLASLAPTLTSQTPAHSLSGTSIPGITNPQPPEAGTRQAEAAAVPVSNAPTPQPSAAVSSHEEPIEMSTRALEPEESEPPEVGGQHNADPDEPRERASAAFDIGDPQGDEDLQLAMRAAGLVPPTSTPHEGDCQRTPRSLTPVAVTSLALNAHNSAQHEFLGTDPRPSSSYAPSEVGRSYTASSISRRSGVRVGAVGSGSRPRVRTVRRH